jgi:hypothetical protein
LTGQWILISVFGLLAIGAFAARHAGSRRRPAKVDNVRYVRYFGTLYLSADDLADHLDKQGNSDVARSLREFAREAEAVLDQTGKSQ